MFFVRYVLCSVLTRSQKCPKWYLGVLVLSLFVCLLVFKFFIYFHTASWKLNVSESQMPTPFGEQPCSWISGFLGWERVVAVRLLVVMIQLQPCAFSCQLNFISFCSQSIYTQMLLLQPNSNYLSSHDHLPRPSIIPQTFYTPISTHLLNHFSFSS